MKVRNVEFREWAGSGLMWLSGYCALPLAAVVIGTVFLSGCSSVQRQPPVEVWPDMKRQEKYKPQSESSLFSDGRSNRRPVAGTISRETNLEEPSVLQTGMQDGKYVGKMPVKVDMELLKLGQAKFNTYCSPCHDKVGTGKGIVALRTPSWQPSNLLEDRLKNTADGDIYWVITHGRRTMPGYEYQISDPKERWAVVAYVRALQRASVGSAADMPQRADAATPASRGENK